MSNHPPPPSCPRCGRSDQTRKVSRLYLEGISGRLLDAAPEPAARAVAVPPRDREAVARARELSRRLAPPAGGRRGLMRPLQPDMVVVVFGLVAAFFVYQIGATQPAALVPSGMVLLLALIAYLAARRSILRRFTQRREEELARQKRVEAAVGRWMKLYYCARDDGVFAPGEGRFVPADELADFLAGRME